jgi:hypothetical protein
MILDEWGDSYREAPVLSVHPVQPHRRRLPPQPAQARRRRQRRRRVAGRVARVGLLPCLVPCARERCIARHRMGGLDM